jgi:hypothetical protein
MSSKRLETAKRYIAHFATLDTHLLEPLLAETYTHLYRPALFNPPSEPLTTQGILDHYARVRNVLSGFPMTAKEYFESEGSNAVTVWATGVPEFREDVKDKDEDWGYQGEYIYLLSMDQSGEKITRIVEFLDSKATVEKLSGLMERAGKNLERRRAGEKK